VIITMSGHGTQQRDISGDEADGRDEVFLPADTARSEPGSGVIPNAIIDDELGDAVRAIRRKGADVWLVVDSCHSGSALRAGGTRTAARFVDPNQLGVSLRGQVDRASKDPFIAPEDENLPGGLMAFYSAQSDELAREIDFASDKESGETNNWYGLFTSRLAMRLRQGGAVSYGQMFQAVQQDMRDAKLPGVARLQTPLWEGTMIEATVLGGRGSAVRQFAVDGDRVAAGRLHGLTQGTVVALVSDAAADAETSIAIAQIEEAAATTSYMRPVSQDCRAKPGQLCDRAGQLPANARFARPQESVNDLTVGLALSGDWPDDVRQQIEAAIARRPISDLELTDDGRIEVRHLDGRVWFGQRAAMQGLPLGATWSPDDGNVSLDSLLNRIVHAERLAGTLDSLQVDDPFFSDEPVEIAAEFRSARLGEQRPGEDAVRECGRLREQRAFDAPEPLESAIRFNQCDMLRVTARGNYDGTRDVNRIHIDATFCVYASHERIEGSRRAVPVGGPFQFCADCPTGPSAGDERLYIVTTAAQPNSGPTNLKSAVENCGRSGGGATRGDGQALADLIGELNDTNIGPTRGGLGGGGIFGDVWVKRYEWTVLPRALSKPRDG
ncbi:MAG: hypothetical protein AAF764_03830, partial [Pseudomonadota bacterium]